MVTKATGNTEIRTKCVEALRKKFFKELAKIRELVPFKIKDKREVLLQYETNFRVGPFAEEGYGDVFVTILDDKGSKDDDLERILQFTVNSSLVNMASEKVDEISKISKAIKEQLKEKKKLEDKLVEKAKEIIKKNGGETDDESVLGMLASAAIEEKK